MRRALSALILVALVATQAGSQEATITSPAVKPADAKYTTDTITITQASVYIVLASKDSGNNETGKVSMAIPDTAHPSATVAGFFTALDTVRATETGGALRKANFRILGYLFDNGYLSGTTVAP